MKNRILMLITWALAITLAAVLLLSCQKSVITPNYRYIQTIKASFYELDSTESIVVKQYDFRASELASQEFKVNSLDFQADMEVKNAVPSFFIMYLKDEYGHLMPLETRVLR